MSSSVTPIDLSSASSADQGPRPFISRLVPGLRGRLLLAFIAISLFVIAAGAAGLYTLGEVGQTLDRITLKTVPAALDAQELSRKSETIVVAGPALANAIDANEVEAVSSRAAGLLVDASTIHAHLRAIDLDPGALDEVGEVLAKLGEHLSLLRSVRLDGIIAADQKTRVTRETFTAYRQFGDVWRPRFADMRSEVLRQQRAMITAGSTAEERRHTLDQFAQAMIDLFSLDHIQREAGVAFELIIRAANTSDPAELDTLAPEAQRSIRAIDGLVSDIDPDISTQLFDPLRKLRSAGAGDASIFSAAHRAIAANAESRRLIAENEILSAQLKGAIDALVSRSRSELDNASIAAWRVQKLGRESLLAVAGLSLASSLLIVWLYVGRNIVARLARLSGAMIEIASGGRETEVPAAGTDEVAAMGRAVEVFRRNAIELDELLVERAEAAARLEKTVEERTAELTESLEYQTATSDVLKVIIRSTSDLQPLLDTVAETAARLCGAERANIYRREADGFAWVAGYGWAPAHREFQASRRQVLGENRGSIVGRVALEGGSVVHIHDVAADPEYTRVESVRLAKLRTGLGVPMLREGQEGQLIGVITLGRLRVEPFTQRQIELLRTFADQAVIAMENARLLDELRGRTDELTRSVAELQALEEVLRAVNSSLDLDTVLATIIGRAVQLSQADEGTIYEFDETEQVFVPKSAFGMSAERVVWLRERRVRLGETHLGRAAVERAPVHVDDVQQDPTLDRGGLLEGIHAVLAVPLLREDKIVGGLVIRRRTAGGFASTIPTLLQTFAGQAVLAIEHARLFQELAVRGEEARRARDAAEEANRTKSTFLANMSHELRTPLNAIIGVTEMLQEDARDLDRADELEPLDRVSRAARHLLALINDILDLSKIEAGRMELEPERFSIAELVDEVTKTIEPLAVKNGNQLVVNDGRDVGSIYADQMRVRQTLMNLVSNAVKFTENGTVTVSTSKEDGSAGSRIAIAVEDTGIGMSPEQLGRLFQEFSQADSSTTRRYGGTGLGLVISRRFCQMMGGDIAVESELGRGSKFTIFLPSEVADTVGALDVRAPVATPVPDQPTQDRALVLVVDDDETACAIVGRYLEREGYEVAKASGGREGLRLASALNPTAITLDIAMPDLDGWTVLAALKGNPATSHIPVVLLTIVDEKSRGFALGATEYLVKPVDREQLARALRQIGGSSGDVLIIDDDHGTRHGIKIALAKLGWRVAEAENGRVALERLAELRPNAILLDLMMPTMDGFEFLDEMRQHDDWADIPVIVITARDLSEEDRIRINGRIERVILKTGGSELLVEVRQALERNLGRRPAGKAGVA